MLLIYLKNWKPLKMQNFIFKRQDLKKKHLAKNKLNLKLVTYLKLRFSAFKNCLPRL